MFKSVNHEGVHIFWAQLKSTSVSFTSSASEQLMLVPHSARHESFEL